MSKQLTSPVPEYPGHVTIPARFTAPQYLLYKQTSEAIRETSGNYDALALAALPGVIGLVEEWAIDGLDARPTLENFPVTPIVPAISFLLFIWGEINKVVMPTVEVPNESSPQP